MPNENSHLPLTEAQMRERIEQGLASLSLEGMHPSKEMRDDLELMITKQITADEFWSRCVNRVTKSNDAA